MTDEAIRTREHDNALTVAEACKVIREAMREGRIAEARADYGDILQDDYLWAAARVDVGGTGAAENWMRVEEALRVLRRANELVERRR